MEKKNKKKRKRLKWLRLILFFCIFLFLLLTGTSWYMLRYSLKPVNVTAFKNKNTENFMAENYPFYVPWMDSLSRTGALCDTVIVNHEGKRLHAYYVKAGSPTVRTAVVVHGYTDNALRMMMIGYLYHHDLGYNILLPDLQFHGDSEGEAIQMGWKDRLDVLRWMDVANELFGGQTEMVVHGISMGAATAMMVSGEPQQPYVKAFVEDCGYTSVWDQFAKELKEQFHLSPFPVLQMASLFCEWQYGWNFREASALEQVSKCTLPMLFIHGDKDDYVPTWMVKPLYDAKPAPKDIWIAPGSDHANSYRDHKQAYTERVARFLDKAFATTADTVVAM